MTKQIQLSNGIKLAVTEIANIAVFSEITKLNLAIPQIPIYKDEETGREYENPHHPQYVDSLLVYEARKSAFAFEILLRKCVEFDRRYLRMHAWQRVKEFINLQKIFELESEEIDFLRFFAFDNPDDRSLLANEVLLTESRVHGIFQTIQVSRGGVDINRAHLKHSVDTGISQQPIIVGNVQLVSPVDEFQTASESGMLWSNWVRCEYTLDEKASAIALHRLNNAIKLHSNDSVQEHAEREARKKK